MADVWSTINDGVGARLLFISAFIAVSSFSVS